MSRDPAARYANLRGKVDRAMENLNTAKQAARNYNYQNASPLRGSGSPPRNNRDIEEVNDSFNYRGTTAPMTETAGGRRINRSPLRNTNASFEYYPATAQKRTVAPASTDLLLQIELLQKERDQY